MMRESWLPATPESALLARALVREAATELRLGEDAAWDLMLATTEAFANAITHGVACDNGSKGILVRLESHRDGVWVEVWDCGHFDPDVHPGSLESTHGRGISIIAAVMDHFELVPDPHHTRVRFAKRRARVAA
jgi:anti-sigma regulatory factor (Ser/Thr protein kinase)